MEVTKSCSKSYTVTFKELAEKLGIPEEILTVQDSIYTGSKDPNSIAIWTKSE